MEGKNSDSKLHTHICKSIPWLLDSCKWTWQAMAQNPVKPTAEIYVIESDEAERMRREMNLTAVSDLLPALVPTAQRMARPQISRYHVGAVALGSSGRIYLGVNVEFPGVPLHHSIHAEQFVVTNAALHGERSIQFIAVSDFPCGHCRQFLQEIRSASQIQIQVTGQGEYRPLSYFLPNPFGPSDLLKEDVPLLLESHCNYLIEEGEKEEEICKGLGEMEERLRAAALMAAREAHAPYSGCPSGFALADGKGRVYAGAYMESAAYNPSLGPVQAAIVAYMVAGGSRGGGGEGGVGEGLVAAVLAEKEHAAVSQETTARVLLAAVAPKARFSVYRVRSSTSPW